MGHNINENKRMFYVGEEPWHGLGTKLDNPATAKEAIMASGLDYDVKLEDIFLSDNKEVIGKQAVVRQDTRDVLGITSNSYKVIQNTECFDFFDNLIGEKLAIYHTAGALGQGEKIWVLAKIPSNFLVCGVDEVNKYLLLTNSHDGKSSLQMYFTPVRVVCQNTLTISLNNRIKGISISHRGSITSKIDTARKTLGIAIDFYKELEAECNLLGEHKITNNELDDYYNKVLMIKPDEDISTKTQNTKSRLLNLFETGAGHDNPKIRHTAWTAYNAVTQYVDFDRTVRGYSQDKSKRLNNIWLGSGANLKARAFNEAMELVK